MPGCSGRAYHGRRDRLVPLGAPRASGAIALALTAAEAAVKVAASLGVRCTNPVVLADGANVIVHLSPAPVVAKVAASTTAVRHPAAWLQRELDVTGFLAERGAPVMVPSPGIPPPCTTGTAR